MISRFRQHEHTGQCLLRSTVITCFVVDILFKRRPTHDLKFVAAWKWKRPQFQQHLWQSPTLTHTLSSYQGRDFKKLYGLRSRISAMAPVRTGTWMDLTDIACLYENRGAY